MRRIVSCDLGERDAKPNSRSYIDGHPSLRLAELRRDLQKDLIKLESCILEAVEQKVGVLDRKVGALDVKVGVVGRKVDELDEKVTTMDGKLDLLLGRDLWASG